VVPLDDPRGLEYWLVNAIYAATIRERWLTDTRRILMVVLNECDEPNWIALGAALTNRLLALGSHVGVSLDGEFLRENAMEWLRSITVSGELGTTDLQWDVRRLGASGTSYSLTLNSVHPVGHATWLSRIWSDSGSEVFHAGADLLLAVYEQDPIADMEWGDGLTQKRFDQAVPGAVAWLNPLDGNMGYVLGLPITSPLYEELLAFASEVTDAESMMPRE
jgi:hypothetical protein